MLIGWYLGRRAVKNARQDVMSLAQYSSASTQAEIAARLLRKMGRMDRVHRAGDLTATIEEASYLLKEAVRDRHHSMNEGARNGRDARWLEATLMESWAMTYLGALKGQISRKRFDQVDKILWRFVSQVMSPMEMSEILGSSTEANSSDRS